MPKRAPSTIKQEARDGSSRSSRDEREGKRRRRRRARRLDGYQRALEEGLAILKGENMKVYFCWSGQRSRSIAIALSEWLQTIVQTVQPWISTEIDKGTRWRQEIDAGLAEARAGIVCLVRENLDNCWIHFESGALAKTKDARLYTFLVGLQPTDIQQPLASFQHTVADKDDIKKLVHSLNELAGKTGERQLPEHRIDELFDLTWNNFERKLKAISDVDQTDAPVRTDREVLLEILQTVREIQEEPRLPIAVGPYKASDYIYPIEILPSGTTISGTASLAQRLAGSGRVYKTFFRGAKDEDDK